MENDEGCMKWGEKEVSDGRVENIEKINIKIDERRQEPGEKK